MWPETVDEIPHSGIPLLWIGSLHEHGKRLGYTQGKKPRRLGGGTPLYCL
jgi:hypothetical protein